MYFLVNNFYLIFFFFFAELSYLSILKYTYYIQISRCFSVQALFFSSLIFIGYSIIYNIRVDIINFYILISFFDFDVVAETNVASSFAITEKISTGCPGNCFSIYYSLYDVGPEFRFQALQKTRSTHQCTNTTNDTHHGMKATKYKIHIKWLGIDDIQPQR